MRSPTAALVWEIWQRHRIVLWLVVGMTAAGNVIAWRAATQSGVADALRLLSFVLLFGVFSYTESADSRGLGRFPQRLFVLPVSSLHLAAVPMLAGLAAVELLYVLWGDPTLLNAVLIGTLLLCAQTVVWTLHGLGPVRLVIVGLLAVFAFWITVADAEGRAAPWVAAVGLLVFAGASTYISSVRSGAAGLARQLRVPVVAGFGPRKRKPFRSASAAHFWYEWRSSGIVLPLLVGGVILIVVAPLSWVMRNDAGDSMRLLIATLGTPVVLAMAVGTGFGKPTFWSHDLAIPAFIAVRPLRDDDLVAVRVKTAAASAAVAWLIVLAYIGLWFALWGHTDVVSRVTSQLRALYGQSDGALYGIGALCALSGVVLTWRFLISRLWSGLAGFPPLFFGSAAFLGVAWIAAMVFEAQRLPAWAFQDPARLDMVIMVGAAAVIAKYALAAFTWRDVEAGYRRQYFLAWLAGTATVGALGIVVWGTEALVILVALLTIPLARVGLAASSLARNRHR